jgi:hypothetical protein
VPELKAVLFEAHGGFADKRVKKLDNASTFLVDDRDEGGVIGADKKPLSWFCHIYADALSDDELRLRLTNVPMNGRVENWAEKNGATPTHGIQPSLEFSVRRGKQAQLDELAALMKAIVAPGARYDTPFYKYSCPRIAKSLDKLRTVLDRAWTPGSKTTKPTPGSLF